MRTLILSIPLVLVGACGGSGPTLPPIDGFAITMVGNPDLGTIEKPIPFSTGELSFTIEIEAQKDGKRAEGYDGWTAVVVRPVGTTLPEPLSVKLEAGFAKNVTVKLKRVFGTVHLVVVATGYEPGAPGSAACNNGIDDDRDGFIDFPNDRGCFYANDESEGGGDGVAGLSPPITIAGPTIADIQTPVLGVTADESPLKGERVTVNRGWILVTRVGTDGMYVTDFTGAKWDKAAGKWDVKPEDLSYDGIFVYNYSTPLNLQEGDCLTQLDGQIDEFYGYTEMGKPTWKKGDFAFCSAKAREAGLDCPPATEDAETPAGRACREKIEELVNTPVDITKLVLDDKGVQRSVWDQTYLMTERFEAGLVQLSGVFSFVEDRRCDVDKDGVINFSSQAEKECSNGCGDDVKCIVWENYNRYRQWSVNFMDGTNTAREVNIVSAGGIQNFDPMKMTRPKTLSKVVGTLRHLSFGRPAWTIELRRQADCPDCVN
jgi:hypothetical protein